MLRSCRLELASGVGGSLYFAIIGTISLWSPPCQALFCRPFWISTANERNSGSTMPYPPDGSLFPPPEGSVENPGRAVKSPHPTVSAPADGSEARTRECCAVRPRSSCAVDAPRPGIWSTCEIVNPLTINDNRPGNCAPRARHVSCYAPSQRPAGACLRGEQASPKPRRRHPTRSAGGGEDQFAVPGCRPICRRDDRDRGARPKQYLCALGRSVYPTTTAGATPSRKGGTAM